MATHNDPTANQATGNVQQEWIEMAVLAIRIRRSDNAQWAAAQETRFTGIFRQLLTDSEEDVLEEIPAKVKKKRGI